MTQTPAIAAAQSQLAVESARTEALWRTIYLLDKHPGNREAAEIYLRASREYEENK